MEKTAIGAVFFNLSVSRRSGCHLPLKGEARRGEWEALRP